MPLELRLLKPHQRPVDCRLELQGAPGRSRALRVSKATGQGLLMRVALKSTKWWGLRPGPPPLLELQVSARARPPRPPHPALPPFRAGGRCRRTPAAPERPQAGRSPPPAARTAPPAWAGPPSGKRGRDAADAAPRPPTLRPRRTSPTGPD